MPISIVIPTYGRDQILIDTLRQLQALVCPPDEVIVVDQTVRHDAETVAQLTEWNRAGTVRWIRLSEPSITVAMNVGLLAARADWVLFLDDDIIPSSDLVAEYAAAITERPDEWAIMGQILQPGDVPQDRDVCPKKGSLIRDLDFRFNGTTAGWVSNVMASNLCVKRSKALELGGFDENFGPPVSYRFETEFAKRLVAAGGRIRFEPAASIRHLRAESGGTRSRGNHLASASPIHGVGDYYYALRCGKGLERFLYILRRPFREVRTRFHLKHPWYIPVKLIGEFRALVQAVKLYQQGPKYIKTK